MNVLELAVSAALTAENTIVHRPTPDEIDRAQTILGALFPPSYRAFMERVGVGFVGPLLIIGVDDNDIASYSLCDTVSRTLSRRRQCNLDARYIIVGDLGNGEEFALDTASIAPDGEFPVVVISIDCDHTEFIADNYSTYIFDQMRNLGIGTEVDNS